MDMATPHEDQTLFHLTGKRSGRTLEPIGGLGLRPALFAGYRDLTALRHDWPVVLVEGASAAECVRTLSGIVDEVLREVAPRGVEGERLRRHGLALEREIRVMLRDGAVGTLRGFWAKAAARLNAQDAGRGDDALEQVLVHALDRTTLDGEVLDCGDAAAATLVRHVWRAARAAKADAFRARIARLSQRLSDILRAAFIHSEAGRRPDSLQAGFGAAHGGEFDFALMSRLVSKGAPKEDLPLARRARIERALQAMRTQRFHEVRTTTLEAPAPHVYEFEDCAAAVAAFRARLPEMVELIKALEIAELEVEGRYLESKDDPFFDGFDASALGAEDLASFPDYLVCIAPERTAAPENAGLMEALSSGLPLKALVECDDLIEDASLGEQRFAFGVRSARLANTATNLGGVYAVQAVVSDLHAVRGRLAGCFAHRGAGLISVYSGAGAQHGDLARQLVAAAAMESRAFPAFSYDPRAGDDQAARFALEDNPQAEADWVVAPFERSDEALQRVVQPLAFTFVDFALCDARYASRFARVPKAHWHDGLLEAGEWLALDDKARAARIPFIWAVDRDDVLHKLVVDARLMQAAARCRTFWHRLQEQGGIHNSHADRVLAKARAEWAAEQQKAQAAASPAPATAAPAATPAPSSAASTAAAAVEEPARNPDETWIETARCPSCGECRNINDKMFGYDANKQAFVADLKAGTYRQLVEAAEACQVAIIHPGKPWNPAEPGLDELVKRAEAFR